MDNKTFVATVTVHHAHNFGAMLQAYALQQALIKCGYNTEIIDYDEIKSALFPRLNQKSFKGILSWGFYTIRSIVNITKLKRGYRRFEEFYQKSLKTSQKYNAIDEIDTSKYDVVLVGSDQVWSFKRDGNRPYFQLDFVEDNICASYAASMGSFLKLNDSVKENFKKSLQKFKAISVREQETADYIRDLTEFDCHLDMDPVFLLNGQEWEKLSTSAHKYDIPNKYILCYELLKSKELKECTEKLHNETGLPVIVLSPTIFYKMSGEKIILDAGPCEMISLIRNAEYVVTNSFHGVTFSIIFHKVFWAVLTCHGPGRIIELLNKHGLSSRIYRKADSLNMNMAYHDSDSFIWASNDDSMKYLEGLKELHL